MKIQDLDLEAAAIHAENWNYEKDGSCNEFWTSPETNYTWPARAACGRERGGDPFREEPREFEAFWLIERVWRNSCKRFNLNYSYTYAIDNGFGKQVAEIIREETKWKYIIGERELDIVITHLI